MGRYHSGDVLARAVGDIENLENFYVRVFAPAITALLITAGMGWFVGNFDGTLGWVLIFGLLVNTILVPVGTRLAGKLAGKKLVEERATLSAQIVEFTQGLGDLLLFDGNKKKIEEIIKSGEIIGKAQNKLTWVGGSANGIQILVNGLTIWGMLRIAIQLIESGQLDGVVLTVLILASMASFEVAAPLINAAGMAEISFTSGKRLFDLADEKATVVEASQPIPLPNEKTLEVRNLSFRYSESKSPAIEEFSVTIHSGQRIAIVGESGAGKSTLVNLLMRFWQPDSGEILLGGFAIDALRLNDLRSRMGLVPGNGWIFRGSVRANLRIANNDAKNEDCWMAIRQAGLEEWATRLPNGLETLIEERGLNLSGGERQRLLIARTILQDAPIWLLDEPTNNLDALTERLILQTLFHATHDRSSIWIMHRLIGMEKMDEIILLGSGRIVERGTYEELVTRQGKFWQMLKIQQELLVEQ
jgi:thiol reductant ABC exporter CydC subunit